MIVVMQQRAAEGATARVVRRIETAGLGAYVFHGEERDVIAILDPASGARPADEDQALSEELAGLPGVERVDRTTRPFRLASRDVRPAGTTIPLGRARLGSELAVVTGTARPASARELVGLARACRDAGAAAFWAGRGEGGELRRDLLAALDEVRSDVGLPVVVDIWEPVEVDRLSRHADALQVPSQQMQNFPLIDEVGRGDRPLLLCRGASATIEDWLMAAERVLRQGNMAVALCEQGIRTFEPSVRTTLDFSAIAVAKRLSHLPVLANPSLAAGHHELVAELSLAAAAAGADGILLDVHPESPDEFGGGAQPLPISDLAPLISRLDATRAALAR